jgi:hypothetical protein
MAEQKTQITISFKRSPDYKLYPATGVYGGPTPDGHILMHFMVEHAAIPSYQVIKVQEGGRVDPSQILDSVASGDGERNLVCGVVISPDTALRLAEWLQRHASQIKGGTE